MFYFTEHYIVINPVICATESLRYHRSNAKVEESHNHCLLKILQMLCGEYPVVCKQRLIWFVHVTINSANRQN